MRALISRAKSCVGNIDISSARYRVGFGYRDRDELAVPPILVRIVNKLVGIGEDCRREQLREPVSTTQR